ncbi:LysR family transcriptional regulator [Xanthobacter aminoxidans]|uniref:LysR family transcriptional regulator n=1 Tax=Xanthobacter aminoxidans TaxID=186280 RepID=UPI002022CC77|nr:LysR family transcriptional regulator [Xanthobacter aminoxidans]MCL8385266.1 LysR family transcriptional regulator [Xanthobacter aminoxidans]
MNFRQLQTFLEIIRLGSFAAAANNLNATQSTVSARIQELEGELGVALFDRSQRKIAVTSKGRELISYAERALELHDEILHNITPRQMLSGIVRVGVAELVAMTWLPAFVATVHARYPHISLELDISLTAPLRARMLAGDLDVVLLPGEIADPALVVHPLGLVTFRWMAGAGMDLPDHVLSAQDLTRLRVLSLGENSVHYSTILSLLGSGGSAQRPDLCNSMTVIATLMIANTGISVLPPACYGDDIAAGRLRVLRTRCDPAPVPFVAAYRKRRLSGLHDLIAATAAEVSTFATAEDCASA